MSLNKICISLFLVILVIIPSFSTAMSAEQAEGYAIQEATETYLSGLAEVKISTQQEAIDLASKIKRGIPIQKSTLLTGNGVVSSFSKEFVSCPHIIDFIYISGNSIELIESKRSGVGTTDQIKCFDNLGDALKRKGFNIKKKISCDPKKCKLPSQWEKRVVRSIPKSGLTILEVGSFVIYIEILSGFIESTVDSELNRKINLCYNRQELTSSAGLRLLWQVPEKECMCINNNELRLKCCTTVINDIFYSQFNWNKFAVQFPLCRNEADYSFKKCVEDIRNRYSSNIKDAENFCSNLKQSTISSSNTNAMIEEEKLKNFKEEKYEKRCVLAFCWRKKIV